MSWSDDEKQSAEAFERVLLDAAREDAPALDTQQAWAKFAGTISQIAAGAEPGSGLHPTTAPVPERASTDASSAQVARTGQARASYRMVFKWLLLGAIGGSALTAAWLVGRDGSTVALGTAASVVRRTPREPTVQRPTIVAPAAPSKPEPATSPAGDAAAKPKATLPIGQPKPAQRAARNARVSATSVLAAEILRLDAARGANEAGHYDQTIALVEQYHRDFPRGALAPDAEVLAIEALAEEHDASAVARRAASFLLRYPGDPHAARVRSLAQR